ncbi:MAG: ATP-dependent helicase [Endozoicomonadaceae bacterium]|nr:ATP-dependent helicase [Endozoicomonadaceae bacterium]
MSKRPIKRVIEQLNVIKHRHKHCCVYASAGSGKTQTIIDHLYSLMKDKSLRSGSEALVLMFNKDAQLSFNKRMVTQFPNLKDVDVRTFHSFAYKLCMLFVKKKYIPRFKLIITDSEQIKAAREALLVTLRDKTSDLIRNMKLEQAEDEVCEMHTDLFLHFIELTNANTISAEQVFTYYELDQSLLYFVEAYEQYEKDRKLEGVFYFSDLVKELINALNAHPKLLSFVKSLKTHIIVDEAQDINHAQYNLLKLITGSENKLMLVGDVDQSIYGFRGSDPRILTKFLKTDYPNIHFYTLPDTFRFGEQLAWMSNSLIKKNKNRMDTFCRSHERTLNPNTQVHIHPVRDEGEKVLELISDKLSQGVKYDEIIILCRTYSSSSIIELACLGADIDVLVDDNAGIMQSSAARFLFGLMAIASDKYSECPRLVREEILIDILQFSTKGSYKYIKEISSKVAHFRDSVGSKILQASTNLLGNITLLTISDALEDLECHESKRAYNILKSFMAATKMPEFLTTKYVNKKTEYESLQQLSELLNFIARSKLSCEDFIDRYQYKNRRNTNDDQVPYIRIASIHKVKGLEKKIVIIGQANDFEFPLQIRSGFSINTTVEEERRLFYVAITRAIDAVHIISPEDKDFAHYLSTGKPPLFLVGKRKESASRFLYELDWFKCQKDKI